MVAEVSWANEDYIDWTCRCGHYHEDQPIEDLMEPVTGDYGLRTTQECEGCGFYVDIHVPTDVEITFKIDHAKIKIVR